MNDDRHIRVFVSSTFRDMFAEREVLVKKVFPQLRKLCAERFVTFTEVDLRWGITDEQSAEGKVLPLCLAEIDGCRPYFIGLLGERYGWVPKVIDDEIGRREPWLKEHRERSVTELEILHGVLNKPEMADQAFFYFRDPGYVQTVAEEKLQDYLAGSEEDAVKLACLKERIRQACTDGRLAVPPRENYRDPEELGDLVLKDFTELIERRYPKDQVPDLIEQERLAHEAYGRSRALAYVPRPEHCKRLDAYATGDDPAPFVVLGESGSGKSALLAEWSREYRAAHQEEFFLLHFIGSTNDSADWVQVLRRIMGELKQAFNLSDEIPVDSTKVRQAFSEWLVQLAGRGRIVLVLDALNQLEDRDNALDLGWLPPCLPHNIRLIVSTLPGAPLEALRRRDWLVPLRILEVGPFSVAERREAIREFLAFYRKELSSARTERLATADQTANPLFLRTVLDEMRQFGEHDRLDERLSYYLGAADPCNLFIRTLKRWEEDYERERQALVGDAMSLLWASRWGLSESEVLGLLGTTGEPLPRAHWSPLYLAAESFLISRSGLIGFFHDYFREAVEKQYVPGPAEQHVAHLRLVRHFESLESSDRRTRELPWQMAKAGCWQELVTLLTDPEFLVPAWELNPYDVQARWAEVEGSSKYRMEKAYEAVFVNKSTTLQFAMIVATILRDAGCLSSAAELQTRIIDHCREHRDDRALASALMAYANILWQLGELSDALAIVREQVQIWRKVQEPTMLQVALGNLATHLHDMGRYEEALPLVKEQEAICRTLPGKTGLYLQR